MPPDLGNILDNSAKIIPKYIEIIASISHEIIDAGPANFAPIAGRKKIPVPSIEFIVIKRRTGNANGCIWIHRAYSKAITNGICC